MNREILFRGKRIDNEEWIEGIPSYDMKGNLEEMDVYRGFCNCNTYEIDPSTVCQYIGLTDKNGSKIFEGDIVRYDDEIIRKVKIDEVKYNETHAAFLWLHKSETGFHYLFIDETVANKCEVIGNIFDNPELIR